MNSNNPFNVLSSPTQFGTPIQEETLYPTLQERLKALTHKDKLVLFMKGNPQMPMCGFSANTVNILNQLQMPFATFDILQDPEVRQGLKDFSNWPTFPQLYFKGELVGGNDIVTEMFQSGELKTLLES